MRARYDQRVGAVKSSVLELWVCGSGGKCMWTPAGSQPFSTGLSVVTPRDELPRTQLLKTTNSFIISEFPRAAELGREVRLPRWGRPALGAHRQDGLGRGLLSAPPGLAGFISWV